MKIKYLWAHDKSRQKAEAKVEAKAEAKAEAKVYVVYMGDLPKGDLSISALHASMLQAAIGRGKKKRNKVPIILGVAIPVFLLFWVVLAVFAIFRHQGKTAAVVAGNTGQVGSSSPSPLLMSPQMKDVFGEVAMNNYQTAVDMNNGQSTAGPDDHNSNFVAHDQRQ